MKNSVEQIHQHSQHLADQANLFFMHMDTASAKNIIVLCRCLESAVTAHLIKTHVEDITNATQHPQRP